ncbi:MAG TPA: hypothetical protein VFL53_09965 [Pseudolabrys sp.]|nr:hypothetical protein [Pseudolabrys sp.]
MQLVERRSAAEPKFLAQEWIIEELDECSRDDEILLDLAPFSPGRML